MREGKYVEQREDAFYIVGSRVPLAVIVHEYKNGTPVETIAFSFPTLSLEQIHGALAFYHANRAEVEQTLRSIDARWEEFLRDHPAPPSLKAKLEQARQQRDQRG